MKFSLMYPSISTKLKSIYSKKLSMDDFSELLRQPDSEKALIYLKSKKDEFKVLSEDADRIEIETQLDKNLIIDILKIEKLLDNKSKYYLNLFLSKYEIRCIKSVFRKLYSQSIINEDLNNVEIWTDYIFKKIKGINNVTNFNDFLIHLNKTPYYKIFKNYENTNIKEMNIFEIENKLDILYFTTMMKLSNDTNDYILKDIIGTELDLENIIWIYRTKKFYNFSNSEIHNTIINIFYKLSKKDIDNLIEANDYQDFKKVLNKTIYKNILDESGSNLGQNSERYLYQKYKKIFRNNMFNLNFIFAYIEMVDLENNDITNIIEGIRYNLSRNEILQKLVVDVS